MAGSISTWATTDTPNQLWINQRDGTFKDTAFLLRAQRVNGAGRPEASMGIDAGDFDNDGDEDLFVTNGVSEMNILYVNGGGGLFDDRKAALRAGRAELAKTGFGTAWLDFDNDGLLDLLTVNGGVQTIEAQRGREPFPFRMTNQLYRNLGNPAFRGRHRRAAGSAFTDPEVGRGAAFGDIDNDGDVDVIVGNDNGPMRLLINNVAPEKPLGRPSASPMRRRRRDMLGARVAIIRADGTALWRRARADGSYASANDPRVLAGLGFRRRHAVESGSAGRMGARRTWPEVPVRS